MISRGTSPQHQLAGATGSEAGSTLLSGRGGRSAHLDPNGQYGHEDPYKLAGRHPIQAANGRSRLIDELGGETHSYQ